MTSATKLRRLLPVALAVALLNATACHSAENSEATRDSEAAEEIILVAGEKASKDHVHPQVLLSVDRLPAGKAVRFAVVLDVENGWHINTNPPRPEFVVPTTVSVKSKHGTEASNMDYPAGRDLEIEGFDSPVSVYDGRVLLFGTLNVPASAARQTEEVTVEIKFQACNEKLCLAPKTSKLTGKIPVVGQGDAVNVINEKVFEKDEQEKRRRAANRQG